MTLYFPQQPYRGDYHRTGKMRRATAIWQKRSDAVIRQRRHSLGFGASLKFWQESPYPESWHHHHIEWKDFTKGKYYTRWAWRPDLASQRLYTQVLPF